MYLKLFENHAEYEAYTASTAHELPNVSHCIQEVEVHYKQPQQPGSIITYTATAKLPETTSDKNAGLHTNSFSGDSGQLTITNHTFENGVGKVEFNGVITSIGNYAFYYCSSLTSIDIPSGVTSIGNGAFYYCTSLTSIDIPSGVTSIGNTAFYNCSSLTSIDIPNSVTTIGQSVFSNCSGLTSAVIQSGSIDSSIFSNCSGLTSVTIGSGVTRINGDAFYNCSRLTSITSLATTAPTITMYTFRNINRGGTLYVPIGSSGYDVTSWMGTSSYYLGYYSWTKVEQ